MNIFQRIKLAWIIFWHVRKNTILNINVGNSKYKLNRIVNGKDEVLNPNNMHVITQNFGNHQIIYNGDGYDFVIGEFVDALSANEVLYAIKNHVTLNNNTQYHPTEPNEFNGIPRGCVPQIRYGEVNIID